MGAHRNASNFRSDRCGLRLKIRLPLLGLNLEKWGIQSVKSSKGISIPIFYRVIWVFYRNYLCFVLVAEITHNTLLQTSYIPIFEINQTKLSGKRREMRVFGVLKNYWRRLGEIYFCFFKSFNHSKISGILHDINIYNI